MKQIFYISSIIATCFLLSSCGGGGSGSDAGSDNPPPPVNKSPTVDAGSNIRVSETESVALNATASDEDGTIASISWVQLSGTAVSLEQTNELTLSFTPPDVAKSEILSFEVTVTDNNGATAKDSTSVIVVPVVEIEIQTESTAVEITQLSSGTNGPLTLDENNRTKLEDSGVGSLITATDANGNLALMALTPRALDETVEVTSLSTLEVMLRFVPSVNQFMMANPTFFNDSLSISPEIQEAASYISATPNWSLEQPEFEQLYVAALETTLIQIKLENATAQQISKSLGLVPDKTIHLGTGLDGIEPGYLHRWFKTEVSMLPSDNGSNDYQIKIENENYRRWLIAMITDDPESNEELVIDNNRTFIIPSEPDILPRILGNIPSITTPIISTSEYPSEEENQSGYGVHVYGIALSDIGNRPTKGKAATAFWYSAGLTLTYEAVLPMLGTWIPVLDNADCISEFLSPENLIGSTSKGFSKSIASSNAIREYLINNDYDNAAYEAFILVSETIINGGVDCILTDDMEVLNQVIGKFKRVGGIVKRAAVLLQLTEIVISETNAVLEHSLGKSHRFWRINNTNESELNLSADEFDIAPTSGSFHYSTQVDLANLEDSLAIKYLGTCESDERVKCEAYSFDYDPPYTFEFTVGCLNPINGEAVPCQSVTANSRPSDDYDNETTAEITSVDEDGKIRFDLEVDSEGEYVGELISIDDTGGESQNYYFNLQAKRIQPQLSVYKDGIELDYTIDNGTMIIQDPITVEVSSEESLLELELELVNSGYGTSKIEQINTPAIDGLNIEISEQQIVGLSKNNFAPGKSTIKVTYLPTDENDIEFEETLTITGRLADKSVHGGVSQNAFDTIEFTLKAISCRREVEQNTDFATYYERILCGNFSTGEFDYSDSVYIKEPREGDTRQTLDIEIYEWNLEQSSYPISRFDYEQYYSYYGEDTSNINHFNVTRKTKSECSEPFNDDSCQYLTVFGYETPSGSYRDYDFQYSLYNNGTSYFLYHNSNPVSVDRTWTLVTCPGGSHITGCGAPRLNPEINVYYGQTAVDIYSAQRDILLELESIHRDKVYTEQDSRVYKENTEAKELYIEPWYIPQG